MIARLSGKVVYKSIDHLIVDVNGVGYRLIIPLSTYYALPETETAAFHIYTAVREDAIHLYGFLDSREKEAFVLLISVSGVGPRLAVNILSNISAPELCQAIVQGDIQRLSAIPGIGKKTAERLVLELREKIKRLDPCDARTEGAQEGTPSPARILDDALSALVNLGYKENLARKTLKNLKTGDSDNVETIIKSALKILAP